MPTCRKSVLTHAEQYLKNVCNLLCSSIGPSSFSKTDNSAWDIARFAGKYECLHKSNLLENRIITEECPPCTCTAL